MITGWLFGHRQGGQDAQPAARLPDNDPQAASEHLLDVLDARMGELPPETKALVRSMLTVPEAEAAVREFLDERVDNLTGSFDGEDAELRAALVVSSILGLTIARHFLKLRAFETIPREALVQAASAWISTLSADPGAKRDPGAAPGAEGSPGA